MKFRYTDGFTLVELIIYVGLASLILGMSVLSLGTLRDAQVRSQAIAEVEMQGARISSFITQMVRSADSVTTPTANASGSSLELSVLTAGGSPVVFSSSAGSVTMSIAGGSADPITNNLVEVTNLNFTHSAPGGTKGAVVYSFTLSRVNQSNLSQYGYSKTFNGTVTLRN